jgi:hypothetical protein
LASTDYLASNASVQAVLAVTSKVLAARLRCRPRTYPVIIEPGEEILVGNGRRFRVLDVVQGEEEDLKYVGLLQVEAA